MSYINQAPGSAGGVTITLTAYASDGVTSVGTAMTVPALQDVTMDNANDVFTWEQLDQGSKLQVATLATNKISTNIVVDDASFFGNTSVTPSGSASNLGIFGLSKAKTKCLANLTFGTHSITSNVYITGLSPKITATQPVWVTPMTLTVSGDYSKT
mgnify:CR=1 FL=1